MHSSELKDPILRILVLVFVTASGIRADDQAEPTAAIDVSNRLQLFVDDRLIDSMDGVRLELHSPHPAEVVIRKDSPWEDSTMYDPVVIQDGDLYRMWYRTNFNSPPFYTGYAESRDGIEWTKPSLGLIEFDGSRNNNIVWVGNHSVEGGGPCVLCIFKDGNPNAPEEERYKATGLTFGGGLQGLVSPDGLRWKLVQPERVVPAVGAFDTHSISLWDAARREYVVYTRGFVDGVRRIRRSTSDNFRQFPVPELVMVDNPDDLPVEHLYKNAATPYFRNPELMLMFPKRFLPDRKFDPDWPQPGLSDVVFMFSYDGLRFDRRFRQAFIRPGLDSLNWHERAIEVGPGVVPTSRTEMSLYYVEHYRFEDVQIRRGVLRTDGFVSVHADVPGGEFVTHPLVFDGDRLVMNFSTSAAGSIQVELLDAGRNPLPDFTLSDCPEIFGDSTEQPVSWTIGSNLRRFAGQPVRLRFVLKDADLYSIRFESEQ